MIDAISAILLDLDGTLVDSAPELALAVNGALAPLGRRSLEVPEVRGMIGDGIPALAARALAATAGQGNDPPEDAFTAEVRRLYDREPPSKPYPEVEDTLCALHTAGVILILCTNKPESSARALVEKLGWWDFFAEIAGGDRVVHRKPHPDHLLGPLRALGLEPNHAVMVGDGTNDAEAAGAAGIPFILAAYGYGRDGKPEPSCAAAVIERFGQLPGAVAALAEGRGAVFPPPPPAV